MIAIYLAPVYIFIHAYLLLWIFQWLKACHANLGRFFVRFTISIIYLFFATAILIAFFLKEGNLKRIMKLVGNYWLGVLLYLSLTVFLFLAFRLLLKFIGKHLKKGQPKKRHSRKVFVLSGTLCLSILLVTCTFGVINAGIIHSTKYTVSIDKKAGDLKNLHVVMVADLHLGYNIGCRQMKKMVEKINAVHPDLIVIAGDIFDNEYEALDDPKQLIAILLQMKSKYGVYACYGNHDISEKILGGFTFSSKDKKKESDPRMDAFLKKTKIHLLHDEGVLIADSFYLYGRADAERPGRGITVRKTPKEITANLDKDKPILLLDHEPRQLSALADAGVDLDLCGHTHDGQMFPGNITTRLVWENAYGYLKIHDMHNIVTSGVGVFGPNMRVGTIAELCDIQVNFSNP